MQLVDLWTLQKWGWHFCPPLHGGQADSHPWIYHESIMSSWLPWIFLAWEFLSRFALEDLGGERKSRRYDKAQAPVPGSIWFPGISISQHLSAIGCWVMVQDDLPTFKLLPSSTDTLACKNTVRCYCHATIGRNWWILWQFDQGWRQNKKRKKSIDQKCICVRSIWTWAWWMPFKVCPQPVICSKCPKWTIKLFEYGHVHGMELVEGSRLF